MHLAFIHPLISSSIHPSIHPCIHPSMHPSIFAYVAYIYMSTHQFVSLHLCIDPCIHAIVSLCFIASIYIHAGDIHLPLHLCYISFPVFCNLFSSGFDKCTDDAENSYNVYIMTLMKLITQMMIVM